MLHQIVCHELTKVVDQNSCIKLHVIKLVIMHQNGTAPKAKYIRPKFQSRCICMKTFIITRRCLGMQNFLPHHAMHRQLPEHLTPSLFLVRKATSTY